MPNAPKAIFFSDLDGTLLDHDTYSWDAARPALALMKERGIDPNRVRLAAICSVCSEPFTKHVTQFSSALAELGPATAR